QSITDGVKRKCPECGKNKLRRLFGTGAAIMFKGSGFYETDYRSESYKKGAEAAKKAKNESSESKSKESSSKKESSGSSNSRTKKKTPSKKKD
ncbi:MAG: zinc ribbon domain-containing protein, partial [Planctomycetota bacterium]